MTRNSSKSGLFLMELIMSILFFTLAATVCIQMFVKSHTLSEESVSLNHAVIICQGLADSFYGTDGDLTLVSDMFENSKSNQNHITIYYDENFETTTQKTDNGFRAEGILKQEKENLLTFEISFISNYNETVIYSLSPVLYPQNQK